jgi:glycine hydroxymethyltransferase
MNSIAATDPEIAAALASELDRQQTRLELIASENIVSPP